MDQRSTVEKLRDMAEHPTTPKGEADNAARLLADRGGAPPRPPATAGADDWGEDEPVSIVTSTTTASSSAFGYIHVTRRKPVQ